MKPNKTKNDQPEINPSDLLETLKCADVKMNQNEIDSDISDIGTDQEENELIDQIRRKRSSTTCQVESETNERPKTVPANKKENNVFKKPMKGTRIRRPRPGPARRLDFVKERVAHKVTLSVDLSMKGIADMSKEDEENWLPCGYLSLHNVDMVCKGCNFLKIKFLHLVVFSALRNRYKSKSTVILSPGDIALIARVLISKIFKTFH